MRAIARFLVLVVLVFTLVACGDASSSKSRDTTAPVISLTGNNPQAIEAGTAYTELGATAIDNRDGDLSGSIVIDASQVDTSVPGTYVVTYTVTDAAGNSGAATRTVVVEDTTPPVITLLGDDPQIIILGNPYLELGANVTDNVDSDLADDIAIDNATVDTMVIGEYEVTYSVADTAGNPAAAVKRLVRVIPPPGLESTVAILVDPAIAAAIEYDLNIFVSDLALDGFASIIHSVTEQTPPELREYLQRLYFGLSDKLVGAILIGTVPSPRYYFYYPPYDEFPARGPTSGVSYQYYEDLDGEFRLQDANTWLYDEHTGDVESEIWVSVLPPLATDTESIAAIRFYFKKNHDFRVNQYRPEAGYLHTDANRRWDTEEQYRNQVDYILGRVPGYSYMWGDLTSRGNILVGLNNLLNDPVNFPGSDEVFYDAIQTGQYDVLVSIAHGSPYGIGSGQYWYGRDYLQSFAINVTFWFESACSTANLDIVPSFAVVALYSQTSRVLAYVGKTQDVGYLGQTASGDSRFVIGNALANGKAIGGAVLMHRSQPLVDYPAIQREYHASHHILLGDGTLRLQEFQGR